MLARVARWVWQPSWRVRVWRLALLGIVPASLCFIPIGLLFPGPGIRMLLGGGLIALAFLFLTLRYVSPAQRDQWYILPAALCLVLIGLSDLLSGSVFAAARTPLLLVFLALSFVAVIVDRADRDVGAR